MNSHNVWFWTGYQRKWNQTVKHFEGFHSEFNTFTSLEDTKFVIVGYREHYLTNLYCFWKKTDTAMAQATKKLYRINKPMDTLLFADTLRLEKYRWLLALIITENFYSILKKIEGSFNFFLLSAVYRTNPVTMKKNWNHIGRLRYKRPSLWENPLQDATWPKVIHWLREPFLFLQWNVNMYKKTTNISERFLQNLSEKKWRYRTISNKDFSLSNLKNFDVPFKQTQTKTEKGTEFKLNLSM